MSHDHDNLEADIRKLLALLKKIMKSHPQGSDQMAKFFDQKSFDVNLCFLTLFPMLPEDLSEFEEMYQDLMSRSDESRPRGDEKKIEFKLSPDDLDFLKKNGIRF